MHQHRQNALIATMTAFVLGGCAGQYHCYREGPCCTDYGYCTPAPLPYSAYHGCPTPVASSYVGCAGYVPAAPQASPTEPAVPVDAAALPMPAPRILQQASYSSETGRVRRTSHAPFLSGLVRIDSLVGDPHGPPIGRSPLR